MRKNSKFQIQNSRTCPPFGGFQIQELIRSLAEFVRLLTELVRLLADSPNNKKLFKRHRLASRKTSAGGV